MEKAYEIAADKLEWVYVGNIALAKGSNSNCPDCGALLVERQGYFTVVKDLEGDRCGNCGRKVNFRN